MAHFGEELFKRSPFIFWALAPFLVAFALFMPATVELDSVLRISVVAAAVLVSVLALLGLWPYSSLEWPRRALTALVFSVYVLYALDEWGVIIVGASGENRSRSIEAAVGFVIIGLPCLLYTFTGSFRYTRAAQQGVEPDVE